MKMFPNLFLEEIPIAAFGVVAYKRFDCIMAKTYNHLENIRNIQYNLQRT